MSAAPPPGRHRVTLDGTGLAYAETGACDPLVFRMFVTDPAGTTIEPATDDLNGDPTCPG